MHDILSPTFRQIFTIELTMKNVVDRTKIRGRSVKSGSR